MDEQRLLSSFRGGQFSSAHSCGPLGVLSLLEGGLGIDQHAHQRRVTVQELGLCLDRGTVST